MISRVGLFGLREHLFQLVMPLLVAGFVFLCAVVGVLGLANGVAYDLMVSVDRTQSRQETSVILVEVPGEVAFAEAADWQRVIGSLRENGARGVVFLQDPRAADGFYRDAAAWGRVTLGLPAWVEQGQPPRWVVAPGPDLRERAGLGTALVARPQPDHGIVRRGVTRVEVDGRDLATVQQAAREWLAEAAAPLPPSFLINFKPAPAVFGRLAPQRVAAGDIVAEFIRDRVVLIGSSPAPHGARYSVPLRTDGGGLTGLEVQGYATHSVLSESWIREPGLAVHALLLVLFALAAAGLCRLLLRFARSWLLLGLLMLGVLVTWLGYRFADVAFPAADLALVAVLVFFLYRRFRDINRDLVLEDLILGTSTRIHERIFAETPRTTNEQWAQITTMITQLLRLKRTIFLEANRDEPRVREVVALGCSLDDIGEMRRDYRRYPYTEALKARGMISLDDRAFLKPSGEPERQFMAPLIFAGDVQGFWCLTLDPGETEMLVERKTAIRTFAEQIAELLHHAYQRQRLVEAGEADERDVTLLDERSPLEIQLSKVVHMLERRHVLFENVLRRLSTATIVYNLFGHVLHVNPRMAELLEETGFRPYDRTALDFIMEISGTPEDRARQFLRYVILDHGLVTLPVRIGDADKRYILGIHTLVHSDEADEDQLNFEALGVMFELVDVSTLDTQFQTKETLSEFLNSNLRNHFEALHLAGGILANPNAGNPQREFALSKMVSTLKQTTTTMQRIQEYLDRPTESVHFEAYPMSPLEALEQAVERAADKAAARRIELRLSVPQMCGLCIAGGEALGEGLDGLLDLLIEDGEEESSVIVHLSEDEQQFRITLSNDGFGIPDERLQEYLVADEAHVSEEFRRIRGLMNMMSYWKAGMQLHSAAGEGYRAELHLQRVT